MKSRLVRTAAIAAATMLLAPTSCTAGADSGSTGTSTTSLAPAGVAPPASKGSAATPRTTATPKTTAGVRAPDFAATLATGQAVRGSDYWQQTPVVLVFFASWCQSCTTRITALADIVRPLAGRIQILGVVADEKAPDLQRYLTDHDVSFPVILDPDKKIWRSYAVDEPPFIGVVDKGGRLIRGWPGGGDLAEVKVTLDALGR